jgi:diguanylate cyclase (GGDEF)-like protein
LDSTRRLKIAIVDDDPLFRDQVSALIEQESGMRVVQAGTGNELVSALESNAFDCAIIDYELGNETGLALAERLRARFADLPPVVMLTGGGSERTAVKAFRGGFSDYVSKRNLDLRELITAIQEAIDKRRREHERQAEAEHLRKSLQFDSVTGLYSASYMRAQLDKFAQARVGFSVILLRLQDLPEIRSKLGHAMADRALREFARRLKRGTRGGEICGHDADNGFVCISDKGSSPDAVAESCNRLIEELTFELSLDRVEIHFVPSVGAAISPENGAEPSELIRAARHALESAALADKPVGFAFSLESSSPAASPDAAEHASADSSVVSQRTERRRERRQRALKRGQIHIHGLNSVVDCTVRNFSPSGARLQVDGYFAAPDKFDLTIIGSGAARPVELRWQNGKDIGVRFLAGKE